MKESNTVMLCIQNESIAKYIYNQKLTTTWVAKRFIILDYNTGNQLH